MHLVCRSSYHGNVADYFSDMYQSLKVSRVADMKYMYIGNVLAILYIGFLTELSLFRLG